ncbi:MAG: GAF domain-containing protein [Aggregatilineales bacterium]
MTTNPPAGFVSASTNVENRWVSRTRTRWNNLPMGVKLRLSIGIILALALVLALLSVQLAINALTLDSLRHIEAARLAVINATLTNLFDESSATILDFTAKATPDLEAYLTALSSSGSAQNQEAALSNFSSQLVGLQQTHGTLTDIRFINSAGQWIAWIYQGADGNPISVTQQTALSAEQNASYFAPLLAQTPGKAYLIGVVNQTANTLAFRFGVPMQKDGVPVGVLVFTEVPAQGFNQTSLFDPTNPTQTLVILDDQGRLVSGVDSRGQIHLFDGRPFVSDGSIPASVLNDPNFPLVGQLIDGQVLSSQSVAVQTPFGTRDWHVIVSQTSGEVAGLFNFAGDSALLTLILIFAGVIGATFVVERAITGRLGTLTTTARRMSAGEANLEVSVRGQDEIGQLGQALNAIMRQTSLLFGQMEARVLERTRDVELAAEISRDAAASRDMQALLQKAVEAIRERFGFYHVQVFLIDEVGEYAVLVTSTGEAGRQLLARKHRLAVGSASIVGQVTARGQSVVTEETEKPDVLHYRNPLLPDTRSEMALPMRTGGRVIGALDVQSVQPNAFDESNIQIFQVLADQLAIAVDNARLIEASQRSAERADQLNRELTRGAWREYTDSQTQDKLTFAYNRLAVEHIETSAEPTTDTLNAAHAPIVVRGQPIGKLSAFGEADRPLTEADRELVKAVAGRVALAVENARLTQRTQFALAEVEQLYQIARTLNAAPDIETIYDLVADQLARLSVVDRLMMLRAEPLPAVRPGEFIHLRHWDREQERFPSGMVPNARIPLSTFPNLLERTNLSAPYVLNVSDVLTESAVHRLTGKYGVQTALLAPMIAGGRWFGLLVIQSRRPNAFNESFIQFTATLADQMAVAIDNRRLFEVTEAGRATLQAVLDSLTVGVLVIEPDLKRASLFNEQVSALLGFSASAPLADLDTLLARFPQLAALVEKQEPGRTEIEIEQPTLGISRQLLINTAPIRDPAGALLGTVAAFTDTTELRQMEDSLQTNLMETTALYEASRAIAAETNLDRIVQLVMIHTHELLQPDFLFLVFQDETHTLTNAYYSWPDRPLEPESWPVRQLPFSQALLQESQKVSAENVSLGAPFPTLAQLHVYPFVARGRVVGWLMLGYRETHLFTSNQERTISGLSDQLALATESARLSEQTQAALRETEQLYLAGRAINTAANGLEAAQIVRDLMMRFNPDRIDVFVLAGRTSDQIDWLVRWAAEPSKRDTLTLAAGYVSDPEFLTRDPMFVEDVANAEPDQLSHIRRLPLADDIRAQISAPLLVKENSIGRLVISFYSPRAFSQFEQQFVSALAEQAGVVIDNAMLYQQTQESYAETSTLYQVSRAIADSTDDVQLLQAFVTYAATEHASRALLIRLLNEDWHMPNSAIQVLADWSRRPGEVGLGNTRFATDQFPGWKLLATPDVLYINDVSTAPQLDDDTRRAYLTLDLAALVIVPLVASGRAVGALLIGSNEPHIHSDREVRVYASLADQAAIAIENRSLLRQAEARARQLSTTVQVGQAATSILNLNELLNKTVNLIKQSFNYDHVQIFLLSADRTTAVLHASTGEAGRQLLAIHHSLPVDSESVIGRVMAGGKLYNVLDTADSRATHKLNPKLSDTRSELALPLIARGTVIGALDVQSNQPGVFSTEDEQVLGTLADQIAVAIANARLFEQNEQRLEEVRFLFDVTRTAAAVEIDVALNRVTHQILEKTPSDLVVLLTVDESGKRVLSTSAAHEGNAYLVPPSLPLDTDVLRDLRYTHQPLVLDENAMGTLFSVEEAPDIQSLIALPLNVSDKFLGALVVAAKNRYAFSLELVQLLQTLGGALAAIIQNAQLLREIQDANRRLREIDKLKSQFLANMSHELRTPLNSIIGFSRVILKGIDGPLTEAQTQDLSTVYDSGRHLLNLVNDILDQAKIEAGKMELATAFFSMTELIKAAMATTIGLVKDKPIRLHQEIESDLPQAYGDEFRTNQVLLNMLSNAAKFTRQGSITVSAFLIEDNGHPMIQVSVTDTGIGIAKENIHHVFAPFEQVDNSTSRGAEGTGLGMPIAKSLIELQGGRIWVDSEPGIGSTFSITLPIQSPSAPSPEVDGDTRAVVVSGNGDGVPVSADLAAQVEQALTEAETPDEAEHRIVLVIDDEPGMISLYRRYLTKVRYEVIGTTKPDEAADLVLTYYPRAILLDINMPGRTGWEVLQQLKDQDETFRYPVIVCSIEDDKPRGYQLGATEYLVKPFLEEELVAALRRVELERDLPRVLIIGDQPESLRSVREALTAQEDVLRLLEAANGDQGLAMIASHRPALVILDLRMPDSGGFAALDQISADPYTAEISVLVMIAADLSEAEQARFISKHIEFKVNLSGDELLTYVKQRLASHKPAA